MLRHLKITNLCTSKDTTKKVKRQLIEWKKIPVFSKNLYVEYIANIQNSTVKKCKQSNYKMGKRDEQIFQQKQNPHGKAAHENTCNIINHYGNENSTSKHCTRITQLKLKKKKVTIPNAVRMQRNCISQTLGVESK